MNKTTADAINAWYDEFMFGDHKLDIDKIGFFNLGYWKGVDSLELAQINLIEALVAFFTNKDGNILDVACGKGASSKFLTKYFDPKKITGINISNKQLEICKIIAPECNFKLMDATNLHFSNSSFDNVLCIEAAPHFMTRYKFFEEVYRVLKVGGRLAMSDMLHDQHLLDVLGPSHPKENYVPNLEVYKENLVRVGFKYVRVEDSTDYCIKAWRRYQLRKIEQEFDRKRDYNVLEEVMKADQSSHVTCCMVYAIK
jgi:MPBQ/MSBQ methyltransferase